ncbi:MAG: hypothetical protein N2511_04500 [Thermodesulfovibrionales bacterium]|nr:hypothetical protein [Thermodesulfovibrionales bacterium]
MELNVSYILPFFVGTIFGIFVSITIIKIRQIRVERLDEKTLLIKLPFLGSIEVLEEKNQGVFIRGLAESLPNLLKLLDLDTMLQYALRYNINYIGIEGNLNGLWSDRKLAYCTMSKGYKGGYNIYLNPSLNCEAVSNHLSKQLNTVIKPDEVYPFLFFHEIGHTTAANEKSYFTALVNHSLSGGRRSARRRRALKNLYLESERYADEFGIQELTRWRQTRKELTSI